MPRCEHGYDHHNGPHACDKDQHLNQCPYRFPEGYQANSRVRTERMDHNHIFQAETVNGNWDCPACRTIDPLRMRWEYANHYHRMALSARGWL